MLSILIPVFDFDVRDFVKELHRQCTNASIDFEIILLDDHSQQNFVSLNRSLSDEPNVIYRELPANVGRSAIRNQLASIARHKYLLFLDCDSEIESSEFITSYLKYASPNQVIYGGRSYHEHPPADKKLYLRWLYGMKREVTDSASRRKNRYKSFMTNNFFIPSELFNKIRFNEALSGYGHEDTLFGTELKKRHVDILHIDNPLCHIGLEPSEEFLQKTEQGVKNLAYLMKLKLIDNDVKLAETYETLRKLHLAGSFMKLFDRMEPGLIKNLKSSSPSLRKFDIYKLGLLARELREA